MKIKRFNDILIKIISSSFINSIDGFFNNDNSKIITNSGKEILLDKESMDKIEQQIEEQQRENPHGEIIVDLDKPLKDK